MAACKRCEGRLRRRQAPGQKKSKTRLYCWDCGATFWIKGCKPKKAKKAKAPRGVGSGEGKPAGRVEHLQGPERVEEDKALAGKARAKQVAAALDELNGFCSTIVSPLNTYPVAVRALVLLSIIRGCGFTRLMRTLQKHIAEGRHV